MKEKNDNKENNNNATMRKQSHNKWANKKNKHYLTTPQDKSYNILNLRLDMFRDNEDYTVDMPSTLRILEIRQDFGRVLSEDLLVLSNLSSLTSLKFLCQSDFGPNHLGPISMLSNLRVLEIDWQGLSNQLADMGPLCKLTSLRSLKLLEFRLLTDLGALSRLISLQYLTLTGLEDLTNVDPLSNLTQLIALNLEGSTSLADIGALSTLYSLRTLSLDFCRSLSDLHPLSTLCLNELGLQACTSLTNVRPLLTLCSLKHLDLSYCSSLVDVQCLYGISTLESLDLRWRD